MRILHVSHRHFIAGGSDAVFFQTTRMLEEAGHEVVPFCIRDRRNLPSAYSDYFPPAADVAAGRPRDALRYFWNAEAARSLARLIADHGPFDIAHLHIYHGKHTPAILPVLNRNAIPVIQTLHEYKLACPVYTLQRNGRPCQDCVTGTGLNCVGHRCKDGSLTRSAVMWAESCTARLLGDVARVARFLCVSRFQRGVMERAGLPPGKLATLHNCVAPVGPVEDGDGGFLYFGRIETLKGLPTLVRAFAMTGQRLTIAGDGTWQNEMHRRIAGHSAIRHVGFKSGADLAALIRRASAVIVPSEWYENCPMSVLEAKAWGVPVIGAAIGGIPELVRDGIDGFLFAPGDVNDLIRALGAFGSSDHATLRRQARTDAEARFSQSAHRAALLSHYHDLCRPAAAETDRVDGVRPATRPTDLRT